MPLMERARRQPPHDETENDEAPVETVGSTGIPSGDDEAESLIAAESISLEPPVRSPRAAQTVDLDLVRRAREGDRHAFEALYRQWHRRIYNLIYQLVSSESDATDLTQDVFVKLYETLPTLRADEAFISFLYQMAVNRCRDHYRKRGRVAVDSLDQPRGTDEDSPTIEIPDVSHDPHRAMETDELQKRVQDAIRTLSEDHRTVIALHHFQDMELTEIAKIMGCRVGTVKSRLARAREELKRKLRGYMGV